MNPAVKRLLTNRNFVLLWCAYGVSAVGDHLSEMAILAHQDALNPDIDITPLQARMTFLFMLPFFLFGPLAGAVGDRFSRRRVMIVADLFRVGIMFAFMTLIRHSGAVFGAAWGPFLPLALVGVFAALFGPARQAMVPMLVKPTQLVPANAMISGLGMIATMCAALVSGELAERGYVRESFHLDACTFLASAVLVFLIRAHREPVRCTDRPPSVSMIASVMQSFRYIASHRRVAELIGIAVVFWFAGAGVRSVIPAIVKDHYHGGFVTMSRFPAWIGAGLAAGAVVMTVLGHAVRSEMAITWSLYGVTAAVLLMAASVFVVFDPGVAHWVGVVSAVSCGFFGAGIAISYNALLQRIVPDRLRARVFGVLNLATVGGLLLATGVLAIPHWQNLDRWAGFVLIGIALLLAVVASLTLIVRFRRLQMEWQFVALRNFVEFWSKFWYRMVCDGPCTIPHEGAIIVTANHGCVIDPLVIHSACDYRHLTFMVAAEYYNMPIAKHFLRAGRCIPVRRGENDIGATKEAIRRLRNGGAVGVFIQGGIRKSLDRNDLKNGVAMLALRTGAQVIPAHISGTRSSEGVVRMLFSRHHARVSFGPPVDLSEFTGRKGQDVLDATSRKIFDAVLDLAPDPNDHERDV